MKNIAIKVRNYKSGVNIINNNDIERRVLKIIFLSFGFLSILYVLFLGNMIFNIVERRTIEADAQVLGNAVMDLEAHYLAMSSGIDLDFSHTLGFSDAKATFATRSSTPSLGLASSANPNEI